MKDGGSAFPSTDPSIKNPTFGLVRRNTNGDGPGDGMSLRDYFAGQALLGMLSEGACQRIADGVTKENAGESRGLDEKGIADCTNYLMARMSYQIADAMIRQREEPTSNA